MGEKYNGNLRVHILPVSYLGADHIAASVGAITKYPLPCLVADLGTATKILVIDDLIATGGTLKAARNVLEQGGATVSEFFGIVGLPELNYKEVLEPTPVTTLIDFAGA